MTQLANARRPEPSPPRVLMPTWRDFSQVAARCSFYEAQDVVAEVDDLDLVPLQPAWGFHFKESWQRRLLWRDASRCLARMNPGLQSFRPARDYDLFVAICQHWRDLLYVNAIKGWKDRCRTSVCWIDEIWASWIPHYRYWLHLLDQFDHIFVGLQGTAGALAKAINRPCHFLPSAVDVLRFGPYPQPAPRVVDVYSIGRRWDGLHQALLQLAGRKEIFYLYDTATDAGDMRLQNYRHHRNLIANTAKRSRCFTVAPAKMGVPEETHGQLEVGYRFFEGAAAGTVMIGQAPDCESFRDLFGWQDAVIAVNPDGSDIADLIRDMHSSPERFSAIGRRNAAQALRRHDWMHRWKLILEVAGLPPRPALTQRQARLEELAAMAAQEQPLNTLR